MYEDHPDDAAWSLVASKDLDVRDRCRVGAYHDTVCCREDVPLVSNAPFPRNWDDVRDIVVAVVASEAYDRNYDQPIHLAWMVEDGAVVVCDRFDVLDSRHEDVGYLHDDAVKVLRARTDVDPACTDCHHVDILAA